MPQVRKPEVDERIRRAALECFAADGFAGTSMASIAATAGVSTANIYRYYPTGKVQLFEAVVPEALAEAHETLITERVRALLLPLDEAHGGGEPAQRLLEFWVRHRLEVIILLGRPHGTRFAGYDARFVGRLVELAVARLHEAGGEVPEVVRGLLEVIFDNTRRALVAILAAHRDEHTIREAVEGFWSYQLPGLDGFYRWATMSQQNVAQAEHRGAG